MYENASITKSLYS